MVRLLDGKPTEHFKYFDKGTMATIGTNAAVAQLRGGITMVGPVAWLAWVAVHIASLLGNGNRLSTLSHFFVRYLWFMRKRSIPIVGTSGRCARTATASPSPGRCRRPSRPRPVAGRPAGPAGRGRPAAGRRAGEARGDSARG